MPPFGPLASRSGWPIVIFGKREGVPTSDLGPRPLVLPSREWSCVTSYGAITYARGCSMWGVHVRVDAESRRVPTTLLASIVPRRPIDAKFFVELLFC